MSTFLQRVPTKKKAPAKTSLLQSVLTTREALLPFQDILYVNGCVQDWRLHAKTALEAGESVWGGCSAGNSGLECSVEVHWSETLSDCVLALLFYDSSAALQHVLMLYSDGFSTRSQREAFDEVEGLVKT